MQRGKARQRHSWQHPQTPGQRRERQSRQGGTDGTQRERSTGREESRERAAVTWRGAVRKAECHVYLEARTEGKGPRVTCASVSWAGWLHTRLGLRQHGWRSEGWVTRPERTCPALHTGHHSPCCQGSGEKRAARRWGDTREESGGGGE